MSNLKHKYKSLIVEMGHFIIALWLFSKCDRFIGINYKWLVYCGHLYYLKKIYNLTE